jgi:hypothetical protein
VADARPRQSCRLDSRRLTAREPRCRVAPRLLSLRSPDTSVAGPRTSRGRIAPLF